MASKPGTRPIMLLGYVIIFLTFGVFGGWAAVAKIDSAVVAPGKVSLEGNRKVVQHLEGGIVDELLVREADRVEKGDVLLRLNDVEAKSNLKVIQTHLDVSRVIEARLLAERKFEEDFDLPEAIFANRNVSAVQEAIAGQREIFEERRSIMKSSIDILNSRIEQTEEQIRGLGMQRESLEKRVRNFTDMVARMRNGQLEGMIPTNVLSQREDELTQIESSLGQVISEIAQARNVINKTKFEILQVEQEYRQNANDELEEIRSKLSELEEREKVAKDVLVRRTIRAPGSGMIQNLKVHTVGAVIRPGEELMELVPRNEKLIVNARVAPIDIDNITPGLRTEVRFTAFKTRMTPIMLGNVISVSKDVITPERSQEPPYYLARIKVEEEDVPDEIQGRLTAGMPADVIIIMGERTVVNYLASPLMDAIRKSMIEE